MRPTTERLVKLVVADAVRQREGRPRRGGKPPQSRVHSLEESLAAQSEFKEELERFRVDHEQAGQFFYAELAVHATARESEDVYHLLNGSTLFWNTLVGALQAAAFIALGRVFDTGKPQGVYRVLRISHDHPEIFSKPFLARRKGKKLHAASSLTEYMKHVYEPSPEDFRRLRRHLQKRKTIYEKNYDPIRDNYFAHNVATKAEEVEELFAATNIQELQRMVGFLAALHSALWSLFENGERPLLRPQRYSTARMRKFPSYRGSVQERITHEAEAFLRAAATMPVRAATQSSPLLLPSTPERARRETV